MGSVDGVICFDHVDKAHVQWRVLLPRQFLLSSYYEHHVNRRALRSEVTLFVRQKGFSCSVVPKATRHDFDEFFACVSHEGDAAIVDTLCPIFCFVQHLKLCIFPVFRHATSPPHSDDDIVQRSERVQFSFVGQDLQELDREIIGPCRLSVRKRTDRFLYFKPKRDIVQWSARGLLLELV